jgi:hypothetical protein
MAPAGIMHIAHWLMGCFRPACITCGIMIVTKPKVYYSWHEQPL